MINAEYLNKVEDIYINNSSSVMNLPELSYFDNEQYDIYDSKDYARFIADTERAVRMSYEYRTLIAYLRNCEGMDCCSFLTNISNNDSNKIRIEIHHSPLTLFDICSTVIKKRLHNKESIDIFDTSKEVMWLHYMGYVGLIPLSETVHKMVHNQYIFIPTNIIRGQYRKFIELYYDYIDPDILDAVDNAEELTKAYLDTVKDNIVTEQMQIFNLHQTYISIMGNDKPSKVSEAKDIIKDRVTEIKKEKKVMYRLIKKVGKNA